MEKSARNFTRRGMLASGGLGAIAFALGFGTNPGLDAQGTAPDFTRNPEEEKQNLEIVADFCRAHATKDVARIEMLIADDCLYRGTEAAKPWAAVTTGPNGEVRVAPGSLGRQAVMNAVRGYLSADKVEFEIIGPQLVKGSVVLHERIDRFTRGDQIRMFHAAGFFFLRDGKIKEWTDYILSPSKTKQRI
jgi:limonene-1,2-epoxide hydrolase